MIIVTFLLKCVREIFFSPSSLHLMHLMSVGMFSVNFFPLSYATHRRCRLSFGVLKCIYVYTRVWIINDIISACRLCPRAQQPATAITVAGGNKVVKLTQEKNILL